MGRIRRNNVQPDQYDAIVSEEVRVVGHRCCFKSPNARTVEQLYKPVRIRVKCPRISSSHIVPIRPRRFRVGRGSTPHSCFMLAQVSEAKTVEPSE